MTANISVIIPTRNRAPMIKPLLDSFRRLSGLERLRPEIIIGDNDSDDGTWELLQHADDALRITPLRVRTPGKSSVLNAAIRAAHGDILLFIDDDVILDAGWLDAVVRFFENSNYQAGQGVVRIQALGGEDAECQELVDRYRTIPTLEYHGSIKETHSLNGANMAIHRQVLDRIGPFDERLGPGASGTSEDVELARRILKAGIRIGYIRDAIVYHRVDRCRLTEEYFRLAHRRQGASRLLINNHSFGRVLWDLGRSCIQHGYYSLFGNERDFYRSKGRVFHYSAMLEMILKTRRNGAR
jgi:GT2 family glycosyltransferase